MQRERRTVGALAVTGAVGAVLLVGCSGPGPAGSARSAAPQDVASRSSASALPTTAPATASTPAGPLPAAASSTGSAPRTATSTGRTTAPPMPTLGIAGARGPDVTGLGQVRPTEIDFNGDPTSVVTHIAWSSWGGAQAVGTGMSTYVAPDQETAQGTVQPMTVVAFDLGECDGVRAYQRVEWYAPQHGDSFDPGQYLDTCAPGGS